MANGLPFCVADGSSEVQCPCLDNFSGQFCNECAPGFFNFPECTRKQVIKTFNLFYLCLFVTFFHDVACECNMIGSKESVCDRETGQCSCNTNYGSRKCDKCNNGYYKYPTCSSMFLFIIV